MKLGMAILMQNPDNVFSDAQTYRDEVTLIRDAEAQGFDSLWCVEHHFDDYAMIPNPLQLLTYVAGMTERIQLGTAQTCVRRIRELQSLFGSDHFVGMFRDGGMPIARARESIERFMAEVAPEVRGAFAAPSAGGARAQRESA